ncbi:hypothetical protein [Allorhizocola rhizosphaerae]|uniref:hypothetical protein n=1 Tax=Allorhizocola rhizosphaerae TaxID=1872709 RepID=UPI000E3D4D38|nr:hypothetical protein [Allorhizocola rhizosphaerae]
MPQLLTVRIKRSGGRRIRVWVPVLPVVLVLSPILVPAVLAATVACRIFHISALGALGAGWRFVSALPGARFDVEQGSTAVLISIR